MHEWFAQPIADGRTAAARDRATAHRLRIADGRDLASRLGTTAMAVAERGSARLQRRQAAAAVVVRPACC